MVTLKTRSTSLLFLLNSWYGYARMMGSTTPKRNGRIINEIHDCLESYRKTAEQGNCRGPIVLITGPTDVGKSTLTKSLVELAIESGWSPLHIDIDVGQNSISIPGSLAIASGDKDSDVSKRFAENKISAYFFGYKSPESNKLLYYLLLREMGEALYNRLGKSAKAVSDAGAIIDTCGWVNGGGYKAILHAAEFFCVNVIIVLCDRSIYSSLKADLPSHVEIRFYGKLKGIVKRSKPVRKSARNARILEYFNGQQFSLEPYKFNVPFSELRLFRVSSPTTRISSKEFAHAQDFLTLEPVTICPELNNQILAVSKADTVTDVGVMLGVSGFICFVDVDIEKEVVTVLSANPAPLTKKILLVGDIKYSDN